MTSGKNQREPGKAVQAIASVIGLMIAVFTLLAIFLPAGLTQPIGAVIIGLIGTAILVWIGKLNWGGVLLTWLTVSVGVIFLYLIVSRPATVVGSVVDSSGSQVKGLTLILTDANGVDHKAVTDENGAFEIKNVSEGKFTILANGELLISGQVPSGWKRIIDPTVTVGTPVHRPSSTVVVAVVTPNTPTSTPVSSTNTPVPPTDTSTPEPPTSTAMPTPFIIDDMDSTLDWKQYGDDRGSSMVLRSTPGMIDNAVEISFDLKQDGYAGISKVFYPRILSGTEGIGFSYNGSGAPNTIEFKLLYTPDNNGKSAVFSVEWRHMTATNNWTTFEVYFKRLRFGLFQRTENSRITRFPIQLCVLDERFG
jgi:hypothetical protein